MRLADGWGLESFYRVKWIVIILTALMICVVAGGIWMLAHLGATPVAPAPAITGAPVPQFRATELPGEGSGPAPAPGASANPLTMGSPLAAELNVPNGDAERDVQALHGMIRQYLRILHGKQGPPIGDDMDLAHALTGHNPMKAVLIPPGNQALSPDGHLRDRWGTPYFIHPIGYGAYEVRSAGPDRKMFTSDDVVDGPDAGQRTALPEDGGSSQ